MRPGAGPAAPNHVLHSYFHSLFLPLQEPVDRRLHVSHFFGQPDWHLRLPLWLALHGSHDRMRVPFATSIYLYIFILELVSRFVYSSEQEWSSAVFCKCQARAVRHLRPFIDFVRKRLASRFPHLGPV